MKRPVTHLTQSHRTPGFTLLELLLAVASTVIMLTLTASGIITMMQVDQKSESEITRRTNLNQAMDFITDEMRMAKGIAVPASGSVPTPGCGNATGVLTLTMPDNSQILYYVTNIDACSNTVWLKPVVINRRVVTSTNTVVSDMVLMDAIMAPTTAPTCSTQFSGADGFYACIDSNNRSAMLYLYGRLTDGMGTTSGVYSVINQASARSF